MENKPKIPRKVEPRVTEIGDIKPPIKTVDNPFVSLDQKREMINKALDDAEKKLQALGCPYFLAAIDRDPRDTDGGKVFVNSEHNGADMSAFMQHAFPANKDLVYLGIAIGNEIMRRNKDANIKFRENKRKSKKK